MKSVNLTTYSCYRSHKVFHYTLTTLYKFDGKCIEGSSHYLGDKQDFDVSSKGPTSGNSKGLCSKLISRRRAFARNVEILFIA